MIGVVSFVFGAVATLAGVTSPESMRWMVPVASTISVSEIVFPFGHWLLVAVWLLAILALRRPPSRRALMLCIGVGALAHVLVLVTLFVPRLADRAAFSASVYLVYAHAFCAAALVLTTAWAASWSMRLKTHVASERGIQAALLPGWLALLVVEARYNYLLAALVVLAGVALALLAPLWARWWQHARFVIKTSTTQDRLLMSGIFIVAVALRLLYVGRVMSDANYLDAGADGRVYDEIAWSIAQGNGVPGRFTERFPLLLLGHVWLAAAVYSVAGHSYFALTAVQSILGAFACVLLYAIVLPWWGRPTAVVSAAFAAVSFPLVFAAATIGHQGVDIFMTALIVWMLMRTLATNVRPWWWALIGAAIGFAFTVRETNIFFFGFLIIWIAFVTARRTWSRTLLPFAAGAVLMVLPFMGAKLVSPEQRAGMLAHFDRMYRGEGGSRATTRTDLVGPLANPQAALDQLRADPGGVLARLSRDWADNFAAQFLTQPYGGFDLVFLRKGSEYYYGMWFYAYALTVVGTILVLRRMGNGGVDAAAGALVLGLLASRTVPHLILASDYRHRAPIEPFLIMLASVGVVAMYREVMATAASTSTSGFTGSDWRVSQSSGTWTPVT